MISSRQWRKGDSSEIHNPQLQGVMSSELSLINKVELRFALTANDEELESTLDKFLTPVLLKLASPLADVRQAVFKILQQIIPRINSSKGIRLPVLALIKEAQNPNVSEGLDVSNVRLYSLLFASKGVDRLGEPQRNDLVPKVIEGISQLPPVVQARLFAILCKILATTSLSSETGKLPIAQLDEQFLSQWISKFFLMQVSPNNSTSLPGLSVKDVSFFTKDAGVAFGTNQELSSLKSNLLSFIRGNFGNDSLKVPYLIASVDSSSTVRDSAEISYRKLELDLENPTFINSIVRLFVGDDTTPSVGPLLQDKIVQLLSKSSIALEHQNLSEICKMGLNSDYLRLKQLTVQFVKWLNRSNSDHAVAGKVHLDNFHSDLILQLHGSILSEGWPRLDASIVKNYASASKLRALQYEAIGNILRANPNLFVEDVRHIDFLFKSLEGEDPELRPTIQEALSSLTSHLLVLSTQVKLRLKAICKYYMDADPVNVNIHSCRFVSVKYVNCAFPFDDSEARFICILGTVDGNLSDTIEEARKGLHPYWFGITQSPVFRGLKGDSDSADLESAVVFPSFDEFVDLLSTEVSRDRSQILNPTSLWLAHAVEFAFQILLMQAVRGEQTVIVLDQDWHVRLENAVNTDDQVQRLLARKLDSMTEEQGAASESRINRLLSIIFDSFLRPDGNTRNSPNVIYGDVFIRLLSLSPSLVIAPLIGGAARLLDVLLLKTITNDRCRKQMDEILGILVTHPANDDHVVLELLSNLAPENLDATSSKEKLLISSYVLSRLAIRGRENIIGLAYLEDICQKLRVLIADPHCYSWVLECLEQLSISGILGPRVNSSLQPMVQNFLDLMTLKVKKCDEQSISVYCLMTMSLIKTPDQDSPLTAHEDLLFQTHVSKQADHLFTSGEGLLILATEWHSRYLQRKLDIRGADLTHLPSDKSRITHVLSKILSACANTKPSLRKAGCIWLLSMVQYCGHLDEVAQRATEIQMAFMRLLASRDDLVQESASRGLSLVYEAGNKDLKDTLMRGLLKSFTDTNSASQLTSGSVGEETELFDQDVLKTHDGSVSTYKDVLNLASEVGDPSLVYKFMSLAKSSTLWSSRKGIAFGLGSILSKSSLDELLATNPSMAKKLIPKLYRYRYDPSSSVERSMNEIWNALVKDPAQTIRIHFTDILEELLRNMGNSEWRVRQASTAALNDLLQTTQTELYENRVQEIWKMSFRAMDDVKESVRKEGNKLTKSLANFLLKLVDCTNGGTATKARETLDTLVPFLLGNNGLLSDSNDVKDFALRTLMKACKVGGDAVVKFIPTLIENFILLVSSLENEAVNYLIMNADKYNLTDSEIDAKRLQGLGHSPLMEAAEKLMKSLNDVIMPEFILKLESAIRSSIGLPSKVAGSRVIILLITAHYELTKPYGTKLLQISIHQMQDKNITIASAYATAAGYACRLASMDSIVSYSKQLQSLYFETQSEKKRNLAAVGSEAVSKYAGDAFQKVLSAFLPLAFIGKNDACESVKGPFDREWIENTSSDASVNVYVSEVLSFFQTHHNSSSFEIRKVLARSICLVALSAGDEQMLGSSFKHSILDTLVKASKGRSWDGKEYVFEALVMFAIKLKGFVNLNSSLREEINRVAIVETQRRNKLYQKVVLPLLGRYIHEFTDDELVRVYVEGMQSALSDSYYKANEDDSSDDENDKDQNMEVDAKSRISNNRNIELEEQRLELLKSIHPALNSSTPHNGLLIFTLSAHFDVFHLKIIRNTWRSQLAVCENLKDILNDMQVTSDHLQDVVDLAVKNWDQLQAVCTDPTTIENTSVQFIRLSSSLLKFLSYGGHVEQAKRIMDTLVKMEVSDTSSIVKTEIRNALSDAASTMS